MRKFRAVVGAIAACTFFLSSCVTSGTQTGSLDLGPLLSSSFFKTKVKEEPGVQKPKIDIIIPVFDPGLPEDTSTYKDEGIWPELRRAEATRFSYKMKVALEETGAFGAIRVMPDKRATGDLYILGKINDSDGEEVDINVEAYDIGGKLWFSGSFDHDVPDDFFTNIRNKDKDPYDPVFEKAATRLVEELQYHAAKDLENLQALTTLRFGSNFSEEAFTKYMKFEGGKVSLASFPSSKDTMLKRIEAIRVRDQLFVDQMQTHYEQFSKKMDTSYAAWQEHSFNELKAEREANIEAAGTAVAGVALIGLAVLAVVAGANSDSFDGATLGATAGTLGGMAGASLLQKSFKHSEEAKIHREALEELGQSMEVEIGPQVVEFEEKTETLTGNAKEQFSQWRGFLKKIYEAEATPNIQL